ncbi:MAG: 50S ribosomal protein L23 [Thaumarchaeota archaeon]|nr:MAG: 50S ribosomal protein L23 [Thaumarchaeota archaeon 13_1_20CM_2_39_20]TLX93932.1 MAG: 50S ribosomal protein L23 [Nitrososphaerota archaeon]
MNIEEATHIVLKPYVTEKTFSLVENEKRICFLVKEESSKPKIMEAVKALYNETPIGVNVCRTVYGKKAFVKFETVEKARDLATKIGML